MICKNTNLGTALGLKGEMCLKLNPIFKRSILSIISHLGFYHTESYCLNLKSAFRRSVAIQQNSSKVINKSNSFIAIKAINGKYIPPILIGNLVGEIKNLALHIENITFQFIGNTMANRIAK